MHDGTGPAPGAAVLASGVPAPPAPSTLTVEFSVPAVTTGSVATRAARTAAAWRPRFEVTLNQRSPSLRAALPQLGWTDIAATGSGTTLSALLVALGPVLAPSASLQLCDRYFSTSPFQQALRVLDDDDRFVFPSSSCHVVAFWRLLSAWASLAGLLSVDPVDFLGLDPIAPRLGHPLSFAHELSSDRLGVHCGGSLALWCMFTALVGEPGDLALRMDASSSFMAVVRTFSSGVLADASSRAAQMVALGEAQSIIDDELLEALGDCLASLLSSSYLLRLSGLVKDSRQDRQNAHAVCFQPSQIPAVLLRNFVRILAQFPALGAVVLPSSAGEAFAAVDSLRMLRLPSSVRLDYATLMALEVGLTAPEGGASVSLLPSLLHATFACKPVHERTLAALEMLQACAARPPGSVAVSGSGAVAGSAPPAAHSRQLRLYFASPSVLTLDVKLSQLKSQGDVGVVPFLDAVTRARSVPLLRILLGVTSSVPTEADGICSILSMRAHLPRYWFSVIFSSLQGPVTMAPSLPQEVAKYRDEWLLGEGVLFAPLVLAHGWLHMDWWGLHAFEQMCILGGEVQPRPVGHQFLDGPAHLAMAPFVDGFICGLGRKSGLFWEKTSELTPLYATATALQKAFPKEAEELRSALNRAVLMLLTDMQSAFSAALVNPSPLSTLPGQGKYFEFPAFGALLAETQSDVKHHSGRKSRVFSELNRMSRSLHPWFSSMPGTRSTGGICMHSSRCVSLVVRFPLAQWGSSSWMDQRTSLWPLL